MLTGRRGLLIVGFVGGIIACWVLLMPPGSGPDEPGHLVRSGAIVRGEFGDPGEYDVPDSYLVAEPGCYAFQPTVSADCASVPEPIGVTVGLLSRAGDYPVWGHLVFGVASLLPGLEPLWWARIAGAAISAALVGWTITVSVRSRPLVAAATLLALTPMAWSTFAIVNPSSIATAGAIALWGGLLYPAAAAHRPNSSIAWLTAVGWAALALPRRDGLIWACIALAFALAATNRTAVAWWRSLPLWPRVLIALATVATVSWGVTTNSRSSQLVLLAPLIVVAVDAGRWWWSRPSTKGSARIGGGIAVAALGMAVLALFLRTRPGGWNTNLAVDVVAQTDENLVEAIGVLGWLDTLVPWFVVFAWLVLLGTVVAVSLLSDARPARWAAVLLVATAITSWVFELYQGNESGTYWQGRYSLPLLAGVPLLLTLQTDRAPAGAGTMLRRVDHLTAIGSLAILNVAAWAAARRFGVGTMGSHLPWRWDTPIQPVPPILVLLVHAALTTGLAVVVLRGRDEQADVGGR